MIKQESLWESLLRDSSKKSKLRECTILFVGEESSGKYELANCLSNADFKNINCELPVYFLLSNDDRNDEKYSSLNEAAKVHCWILNKHSLHTFGPAILTNCKSNIGVVISLDFSDYSSCLSKLRDWLFYINIEISSCVAESIRKEWSASNVQYLTSALMHRGNADIFRGECNNSQKRDASKSCLDYPVYIVGCNSEVLESDPNSHLIKEIIAYIRYICLVTGATFINTSAARKTNIDSLRTYLLHRMFPHTISCALNIHVRLSLMGTVVNINCCVI